MPEGVKSVSASSSKTGSGVEKSVEWSTPTVSALSYDTKSSPRSLVPAALPVMIQIY